MSSSLAVMRPLVPSTRYKVAGYCCARRRKVSRSAAACSGVISEPCDVSHEARITHRVKCRGNLEPYPRQGSLLRGFHLRGPDALYLGFQLR